jgi:hypothetical protein
MIAALFLLTVLWCAYWSAEAGGSLPWSSKWQAIVPGGTSIPEFILGITVAVCSVCGIVSLAETSVLVLGVIGLASVGVAYAGIQAATWAYLTWTEDPAPNTTRGATIKPIVDFIARAWRYKVGDEGYSWIWAAVKGFIITIPVAGTGLITFPLGHELGSHAKGRLPGDPNMWKELTSGAGIGMSCVAWLVYARYVA